MFKKYLEPVFHPSILTADEEKKKPIANKTADLVNSIARAPSKWDQNPYTAIFVTE